MIRSLKIFSVLLLTLGLIGFMGGSSLLMAGEFDPPHKTHLTDTRGPSSFFMVEGLDPGDECLRCHEGTPAWSNVNTERCATCHTTGGVYNGVTHPDVGALYNWDKIGFPEGADESLIYKENPEEGEDPLKAGKEKWCAGCHDQTESGTTLRGTPIDDFDSGISYWNAVGDLGGYSVEPYLQAESMEHEFRREQGINGQYLKLQLQWNKHSLGYLQLSKALWNNKQNFGDRDSFNFYLLMEYAEEILGIKVGVHIVNKGWSLAGCYLNYNSNPPAQYIKINGFQDDVWKLVSIPRAAFYGPDWNSGLVDNVTVQFFEQSPEGSYSFYFAIDEFGCDITSHNAVGNDQDSGYYKTGHKMDCKYCHDPASAHIDGNRLSDIDYAMPPQGVSGDTVWHNDTGFRFYDGKELTLPYTSTLLGGRGPAYYDAADFALCYECHSASGIETPAATPQASEELNTNFRDDTGIGMPASQYNIHRYHVLNTGGILDNATCVLCHDPHGQSNPAMTRTLMADMTYIDGSGNGCEITDREQDDNANGIPDWEDPDYNSGAVLKTGMNRDLCNNSCHPTAAYGGPCYGPDPAPMTSGYVRTYEPVSHCGDPSLDCHGPDTLNQSHQTHITDNPKGPEPLDCTNDCHAAGNTLSAMVTSGACDNCHSPGGDFDGVSLLTKSNWDNGVYDVNGDPNAVFWCASCHDNGPPTIDGEEAPNVTGDDSTYGFYVNGHGTIDPFNATLHGQSGPGYICTLCHDSTSTHISGALADPRLEAVIGDALPYTLGVSEVCLDCHKVGQSSPPSGENHLGKDAYAEATVHSGGVTDNYNTYNTDPETDAGAAFPAYGESADYATNPGYQCEDCHDPHGTQKLAMVQPTLNGRFGVDRNSLDPGNPVELLNRFEFDDADLTDLDPSATADDGVCDVCHTSGSGDPPHPDTNRPDNHNLGDSPEDEGGSPAACMKCHLHTSSFTHGGGEEGCETCHGQEDSHSTHTVSDSGPHVGCTDCHYDEDSDGEVDNYSLFTDELPLDDTNACNTCHSPGGAFDGVDNPDIGAKHNWADGVYEADGTLKAREGKDNWNWCIGCHDDDPYTANNESALIGGVYAPNIAGDENSTDPDPANRDNYGFNLTGHKASCTNCHDSGEDHIDGNPRTYEVDATTLPPVVVKPYCASYRLKEINGQPPMNLPRPVMGNVNPHAYWQDAALCFDCHNRNEVMGDESLTKNGQYDLSHTNFRNDNDPYLRNLHNYHFSKATLEHFDSDFDGERDSSMSCTACHNVHGPPNVAMIRHGELISPPGTTDALDFAYLLPAAAVDTATYPAPSGTYDVYAWWFAHSTRADNVPYTINYDGSTETIRKNQQVDGDQWNRIGDVSYTFGAGDSVVVSTAGVEGYVSLIADAIGFDSGFDGTPDIIIENEDTGVIYSPREWLFYPNRGYQDGDFRYIRPVDEDPYAALAETIGGNMGYSGGFAANHVCNDCHSSESYARDPNICPKVLDLKAEPATVEPDGSTPVLFTAWVVDPDGTTSVTIDLSDIGGSSEQPMYDAGDGIYSYQTTVPDTVTSGVYYKLPVTAEHPEGCSSEGTIELLVIRPNETILDDPQASFSPDLASGCPGDPLVEWACFSGSDEEYGDGFRYKDRDINGNGTATWLIPEAGTYKVYAWWVAESSNWRSSSVPYTINYSGNSEPIWVDQTTSGPGGGQWNELAPGQTFTFNAGDSIVISDNAAAGTGTNTWVIADAIKLERQ